MDSHRTPAVVAGLMSLRLRGRNYSYAVLYSQPRPTRIRTTVTPQVIPCTPNRTHWSRIWRETGSRSTRRWPVRWTWIVPEPSWVTK